MGVGDVENRHDSPRCRRLRGGRWSQGCRGWCGAGGGGRDGLSRLVGGVAVAESVSLRQLAPSVAERGRRSFKLTRVNPWHQCPTTHLFDVDAELRWPWRRRGRSGEVVLALRSCLPDPYRPIEKACVSEYGFHIDHLLSSPLASFSRLPAPRGSPIGPHSTLRLVRLFCSLSDEP